MDRVMKLFIIFVGSIILGIAFNVFLLPHEVLTGGVTGLAMVLGLLSPINTGIWIIILNIPILIMGWMKLGKEFIGNSIYSVLVTAISMQYIPVVEITQDALLSAVFGGVLTGVGVGLIVKYYGSTGGFDVVGLLITQKRDLPLGFIIFVLNSGVVFISGFIFGWELALYTMASIYITGIVIDRIHTRHIKVSLMVVTDRGEELQTELLSKLVRGITVIEGKGAYSKAPREVLYTVISRYELAMVFGLIKEVDPNAFVSVSETLEVMGNFRKD
ncbi:YitT family protein [Bacillus shivajii]|uniref:YitT family protein n=1 Tax=Bacillus shivajii TaxID=1983719 RepID=UPI001CFA98EE|nr:YitT family protein [Bacillus shivajii]UCZ53881.1 YitT family protein [Bacillus shivajii]